MRQGVRDAHVAAGVPERLAHALVGVVVEDDEVADELVFRGRGAIELPAALFAIAAVRKMQDQPLDGNLDQVDRGRLQRLQKPARQAHADHVAVPQQLAPPGGEADDAWICQCRGIQT
jgi:hypothetical protein